MHLIVKHRVRLHLLSCPGFAKAQSWVSLGMGIGSGALMLVLELNAELPQAAFAQIGECVIPTLPWPLPNGVSWQRNANADTCG